MKITIDFGNDGITVEAELKKHCGGWGVLAGDSLETGVSGFGEQVWQAIEKFKSNFRNA